MSLAYGFTSPRHVLEKAERDLARFETALGEQNKSAMGDALFDIAVALTSFKDWLKKHPGKSFSSADVESYVAASAALSSFRDIANSGKHREITHYEPTTDATSTSVMGAPTVASLIATEWLQPPVVLKVVRADGSRHRVHDLARSAIQEWRDFMNRHQIS